MKRLLVINLERACWALDARPDWMHRFPPHLCRLADWSARLDERWHTGVWTKCGD